MPDITAQAPDGSKHVFPDGTDAAVIDRVMKSYITGTVQTQTTASTATPSDPFGFATVGTGGGPEAEMLRRHARSRAGKDFTTQEPGVLPWLGRQAGGALDATGDLAAAIPALLKTLGSFMPSNASAMLSEQEHPTAPADVQSIVGPQVEQWRKGAGTTGIESLAHKAAAVIPFAGPMAATAGESLGRGEVGRGAVESAAALMARPRFGELGPQISSKGAMQEVLGEGATKSRLLADQHAHALATQQHLATVADAVHQDAQSAMSTVLSKVDQAHPEGVFNKGDIQTKVQGAIGELVKVPEKMPSSVQKILKTGQGGWEGAAVSNTSKMVQQLRDQGLNDAQVQQVLKEQGLTAADIGKGMTSGDMLTAEQLKQMRSDVGQELARYGEKGTVGGALKSVYGLLSDELRGAAKNVGAEKDWLTANNKYSQYARDFMRGPLKRTLQGQTASSIMEPLTGSTRTQLADVLQKYKDAGFNLDMDKLTEEMKRYGMGKTVQRLSQPTKMDLLMAGFSPKALAIRQLGPRLMRSPGALDRFAGEGFDTPVSPRQVYPSKAAAMKATKGAVPTGRATPFEGESDIEMARRGGPGKSMWEEVQEAEQRTKDEAEAKRRAWEERQK